MTEYGVCSRNLMFLGRRAGPAPTSEELSTTAFLMKIPETSIESQRIISQRNFLVKRIHH